MKVLYLGSERSDAQAVATALRGIDQVVSVTWASRPEEAVRWLDDHREVAALVVDAQTAGNGWPSVLKHVRSLGQHPAVVVIVPEGTAFESLHPDAHDYITRNQSLFRDLPVVAVRAIERAARVDLEHKLARAATALQEAERRHQAAIAAAAAQLTERQTQYEIGMARAAASWDMVDEQLRSAAREVERARQQQSAALADVERMTRREAEISAQLAQAIAARHAIETQLAEAHTTVTAATARADQERQAAAEQLTQQQHTFDAQMAHEADQRRGVEALLASRVEDVERLTTRESELNTTLADAITGRDDLERRLVATQAAFEDASTRATRDRLAASKRSAEREAELDGQIQQERAARTALERSAAAERAALEQSAADERAALEQSAADALAALERSAAAERAALEQSAAAERAALEQSAAEAYAALEQSAAETCAALERSAAEERAAFEQSAAEARAAHEQREAELAGQLDAAQTARRVLEAQLDEATQGLKAASACEADLVAEIERQSQLTETLERTIGTTSAALDQARRDHQVALDEIDRLTRGEAGLVAQLADVHAARHALEIQLDDATSALKAGAAREAALSDQIEQDRATRATLEQSIAEAHETIDRVRSDYESLDVQLVEAASAIADEIGARTTLEQTLANTQSAAADTERALREEAEAIRARAADTENALREEASTIRANAFERESQFAERESQFAERESQFNVQLAQERLEYESRIADAEAVNRTVTGERDTLQESLATAQDQSRQVQDALATMRQELDAARAESSRLFEHATFAMFRCTTKGTLTHANRACTTLIGRRTLDELGGPLFAFTVFEAPDALSWLIERCVSTKSKESIETTWRRKDGGRLFVRLSARLLGSDVVEIVAEDLTRLRVLEDRLGQAHRMEAVGRFASEVSITCSNLLGDIHDQGRAWLQSAADEKSRQQGDLLFDELGRAAGFLRQLAACGDEQARTPMLVDLNTLVHDLEPVLKRVAGGDVEVQLRETSASLNVDAATEQVERLLVNLASYGRDRMPFGGRLRIELGTSVVDRRFAAKHPNVRMGRHALITVTEIRRAAHDAAIKSKSAPRPGVDFGTLQGLVSECGGHLWMKVQPLGDMVAKIRLPLSAAAEQSQPRTSVLRTALSLR